MIPGMSPWLIETFGARQLNEAIWFLSLMTAPIWILLLIPGAPKPIQRICQPFFLPVLLVPVWAYLVYNAWTISRLPTFQTVDYAAVRLIARHPLLVLVFIAHIQILNLFLGLVIYQDAAKRKISVPLEMLLCWFGGPAGLLVYAIRRPFSKG
jgi:hypothetical protein